MDVSREQALAACERVRDQNRHKYLSAGWWQCWGCMKFGGEPEKRCMRSVNGWDGCTLVNRLLERPT